MSLQSLRASPPTIRLRNSDALSSTIRFPPTKAISFSTNNRISKSIAIYRSNGTDDAGWRDEGALQDLPVSVDLNPICSEAQFDQVVAEAQLNHELLIVVWMASWCRKCIYLKPKLEKLAAEYYPRLRFYCVDVNAVPHKLVSRAGVTVCSTFHVLENFLGTTELLQKMPTIQLWKDSKKQAEVIGGHKAYLVVNEVRDMIENELTTS